MELSATVITTWGIMALLVLAAGMLTYRMSMVPGTVQTLVETLVTLMANAVEQVLPAQRDLVFPFVATLWVFLVIANLTGVVPGLTSPTSDLSTTAALATATFFFVHWSGIRTVGWRRYLAHYVRPNPIMLPFEIITEISRTVTLAVRLFGNMMSLELAAAIVVGIAGFLVPIPILMLHIVEALIQAYIFGMLALVYVASSVEVQRQSLSKGAAS